VYRKQLEKETSKTKKGSRPKSTKPPQKKRGSLNRSPKAKRVPNKKPSEQFLNKSKALEARMRNQKRFIAMTNAKKAGWEKAGADIRNKVKNFFTFNKAQDEYSTITRKVNDEFSTISRKVNKGFRTLKSKAQNGCSKLKTEAKNVMNKLEKYLDEPL